MSFFNSLTESVRQLFSWSEKERAIISSERALEKEVHQEKTVATNLVKEENLEQKDQDSFETLELVTNVIMALLEDLASQSEESYRQYYEQLTHDADVLVRQLGLFLHQLKLERHIEFDTAKHMQRIENIGMRVSQLGKKEVSIDKAAVQTQEMEIATQEDEDKKIFAIEDDKRVIQQHLEETSRSLVAKLHTSINAISVDKGDTNAIAQARNEALELYNFLKEEQLLLQNAIHWTRDEHAAIEDQQHHTQELEFIQRTIQREIKAEEQRRRDEAMALR